MNIMCCSDSACDVGRKWQTSVSAENVGDANVLHEMIQIRDGFKSCDILNYDDVHDIINQLTVH